MTRLHRNWHLWMWLVIAPLLVSGLAMGILLRPKLRVGSSVPPIAGEVRP
ncbi:MAG: hypothetical protein L0211_07040 [Planctomycetaceae bacterium]|nr:hypothetical protein [Planctomycetaceae bacterium]